MPNWIPAPGCLFGAEGSACLTGQIDAFVEPGRPPSVPVPPAVRVRAAQPSYRAERHFATVPSSPGAVFVAG